MNWNQKLMASKLNITSEAERDIFAIITKIIHQHGLKSVRYAISELKKQFNLLSKFPENGRAGACEGTREIVLTGFNLITVYAKTDTSIMIIRVLEGADTLG